MGTISANEIAGLTSLNFADTTKGPGTTALAMTQNVVTGVSASLTTADSVQKAMAQVNSSSLGAFAALPSSFSPALGGMASAVTQGPVTAAAGTSGLTSADLQAGAQIMSDAGTKALSSSFSSTDPATLSTLMGNMSAGFVKAIPSCLNFTSSDQQKFIEGSTKAAIGALSGATTLTPAQMTNITTNFDSSTVTAIGNTFALDKVGALASSLNLGQTSAVSGFAANMQSAIIDGSKGMGPALTSVPNMDAATLQAAINLNNGAAVTGLGKSTMAPTAYGPLLTQISTDAVTNLKGLSLNGVALSDAQITNFAQTALQIVTEKLATIPNATANMVSTMAGCIAAGGTAGVANSGVAAGNVQALLNAVATGPTAGLNLLGTTITGMDDTHKNSFIANYNVSLAAALPFAGISTVNLGTVAAAVATAVSSSVASAGFSANTQFDSANLIKKFADGVNAAGGTVNVNQLTTGINSGFTNAGVNLPTVTPPNFTPTVQTGAPGINPSLSLS